MAYLRGKGLEIGALHCPLPVPKGVQVQYVDQDSREESIKKFPELDPSKIVSPSYIDNGLALSSVPESSQDFVIANHVLEHASNPIQALEIWAKTLRKKGVLFVSVPLLERNFDVGRPITSIQHLFDDYLLCKKNAVNEFNQRNRSHYLEWLSICLVNIASARGTKYVVPDPISIESQIDQLVEGSGEVHFHTFTFESFKTLLSFFSKEIDHTVRVKKVVRNYVEVIGILKKVN